jgi:outer membrane protein assembly factor BamA
MMIKKVLHAGLMMLLCSIAATTWAQRTTLNLYNATASGNTTMDAVAINLKQKAIPPIIHFNTPVEAQKYLQELLFQLQESGYLAASIDSVYRGADQWSAWIYAGSMYRWARLNLDQVPQAIWSNAAIRLGDWQSKPVQPRRLARLSEQLLQYCENNGYPFATVSLRNVSGRVDSLTADLHLDRGQEVHIDTIIVETSTEVSRTFLQNYLGIKQGDVYNESQLRLITKRLSELAFLKEAQPWHVNFSLSKTSLHLYLAEKKANQLNGIIGLQPNTAETGKFLLTYDLLLGLKNALGFGEQLAATVQRLQYKTLRFHGDASLPYLLGTPLGAEANFDLFNRDTLFVRVSFEAGLKYQLSAADYFKVSYQSFSNRIVSADVNYVLRNKRLPENLDIGSRGAGLEVFADRTNYRLNPGSGWQAKVQASGLLRTVRPNDAITTLSDGSGFNYASLYDTVNNERYQYRLAAELAGYIPLWKSLVLKAAYNGGYINGRNLFLNELYQLGGFRLLRGFDEQSIYANHFQAGTLELRVILGQNSFFYLFSDYAYIHTRFGTVDKTDHPLSFGTGITLENKSGIFNVALGLGKKDAEQFQFRQTRVHFGYTAYF